MSLPILMTIVAPVESTGQGHSPHAATTDPGDPAVSFEMTLGALIAAGQPAPVRAPAAPVLAHLLDGVWSPEQAPAEDSTALADESEASPPTSGDVVPLQKSLDQWLTNLSRKAPTAAGLPASSGEERAIDLDASVVTAEFGKTAQLSTAVPTSVPIIVADSVGIASVWPDQSDSATPVAVRRASAPDGEESPKTEARGKGTSAGRLGAEPGQTADLAAAPTQPAIDPAILASLSARSAPTTPVSADQTSDPVADEGSSDEGQLEQSSDSGSSSRWEWSAPIRESSIGPSPLLDHGFDPEMLIAFRALHHSTIEIGGFSFPTEIVERSAPTKPDSNAPLPVPPAVAPPVKATIPVQPLVVPVTGAETVVAEPALAEPALRRAAGLVREHADLPSRETKATPLGGRQPIVTDVLREDPAVVAPVRPRREAGGQPTRDDGARERPAHQPAGVVSDARQAPPSVSGSDETEVKTATETQAKPSSVGAEPTDRLARRVDTLLLDLKDDQGDHGKIRISVSGPNVRATILPNDPALADRLTVDIRQLRQTLEDRGFTEPRLTVQGPRPTAVEAPSSTPIASRDPAIELGAADRGGNTRQGADDERRDRPTSARQDRQDGGRPSDRSRDQRQQQQRGQRS